MIDMATDSQSPETASTVATRDQTDVLSDYLEVDLNDVEFYERCGNGSYGCVYRAKWISRDREVAVKKLLQLENEVIGIESM
jgi:hypothetical protein